MARRQASGPMKGMTAWRVCSWKHSFFDGLKQNQETIHGLPCPATYDWSNRKFDGTSRPARSTRFGRERKVSPLCTDTSAVRKVTKPDTFDRYHDPAFYSFQLSTNWRVPSKLLNDLVCAPLRSFLLLRFERRGFPRFGRTAPQKRMGWTHLRGFCGVNRISSSWKISCKSWKTFSVFLAPRDQNVVCIASCHSIMLILPTNQGDVKSPWSEDLENEARSRKSDGNYQLASELNKAPVVECLVNGQKNSSDHLATYLVKGVNEINHNKDPVANMGCQHPPESIFLTIGANKLSSKIWFLGQRTNKPTFPFQLSKLPSQSFLELCIRNEGDSFADFVGLVLQWSPPWLLKSESSVLNWIYPIKKPLNIQWQKVLTCRPLYVNIQNTCEIVEFLKRQVQI